MARDCLGWNRSAKPVLRVRFPPAPPFGETVMAEYNDKKNAYECAVTFNELGFDDYKAAYIALRKAVSALKRGKPTDYDLEVMGYTIEEFSKANEYILAQQFETKERIEFIKRIERSGCDLSNVIDLKDALDEVRTKLEMDDSPYNRALEAVLGNIIYKVPLFKM